MSSYNLSYSHPLIPNANEYLFEKKFVSIHSEDRNMVKFPNASEFEIELPQDYINVQSVKLVQWAFPANYDIVSIGQANTTMSFRFKNLYNPSEHGVTDPVQNAIFVALYAHLNEDYAVYIQPGFYNPVQIATELTNRFNSIVSEYILNYITAKYPDLISQYTGYSEFSIIYDSVAQKLWFGNKSSSFIITNNSIANTSFPALRQLKVDTACSRRGELPDFSKWGLPAFLGFTRCNAESISSVPPRLFYDDLNSYWLQPDLPGATVSYLQTPLKINLMGPAFYYMEIEGLNCIDETSPYSISPYTTCTNGTNGVVNSAFAKIPLITTPIAQFFDRDAEPYKWFNPPAERIRKLKIKIRYHDGNIVDFGNFDYTFMLEFNLMTPQQKRKMDVTNVFGT